MGSFVFKKATNGYMFNLYAANHMIIATSQIYTANAVCKRGALSVIRNAVIAEIEDQTEPDFETLKNPKFELYKDAGGRYRFRLRATNGEKILASQGYSSKANCLKGIHSVKINAADPRFYMDDGETVVELNVGVVRGSVESPAVDSAEMELFTEKPLGASKKQGSKIAPRSELRRFDAAAIASSDPAKNAAVTSTKKEKKKGFFARLFKGK
jgi:uncharacterized protein YegP (UPF0339 family)